MGSAGGGGHGIALAVLTSFAFAACGGAKGHDRVSTGNIVGTDDADGGTRVPGRDAGRARGTGGSRSTTMPFGFGELAVDAAVLDAAAHDAASHSSDAGRAPSVNFEVPAGWRCGAAFGRDAICDCGCGADDRACAGAGCSTPGCSAPACQVCFDADGAERDCGAPGAWNCARAAQSDGVCDCGCGAIDPDCGSGGCYPLGCDVPGCELCHDANGAHACAKPAAFRCDASVRGDGKCDCGCGNLDPDCMQSSCVDPGCDASGCDVCHDASGQAVACPAKPASFVCDPTQKGDGVCDCGCGDVDPDCKNGSGCSAAGCSAAGCELCHDAFGRVEACAGQWTCEPSLYGDGQRCDCGCGSADPDCNGAGCADAGCNAKACDVRYGAKGALIVPAAWTCAASAYGGGDGCNCGCGALDPDCSAGCSEPGCRADSCDHCLRADGKTPFDCHFSCDLAHYGTHDGCDCGCGSFDPDCVDLGCDEPGCFAASCGRCFDSNAHEYACERGACRAGYQNDGVCDCGCREADPDCANVSACVEPGCSAPGCGLCHDESGAQVACGDWACSLERQGGGDGCNCGCGAIDPDCASSDGCTAPGCKAMGCVTCRSVNGSPMSCAP